MTLTISSHSTAVPPQWVVDLIVAECDAAGRAYPVLEFHQTTGRSTSGYTAFYGIICLKAGTDETDLRLCTLHEIAHWLPREKHTAKFWDVAFGLYVKHGLGDYGLNREKYYKIGSIHAARRAGVITAEQANELNIQMTERYMRNRPGQWNFRSARRQPKGTGL